MHAPPFASPSSVAPALLLEYLSALNAASTEGSLRWDRFRAAVASVDVSGQGRAGFVLDDLLALGHVERSADRSRWAVCLPALVGLPDRPAAVLTGARSRALIQRLTGAATHAGLGSDSVSIMPDGDLLETVTVFAGAEDQLADLADALAIGWIPDAARRLAACIPSIASLLAAATVESIDDEPDLERLDDRPDALRRPRWTWTSVEVPNEPGVYRRLELGRVRHWLRQEHETRSCDRATAVYGHGCARPDYAEASRTITLHREALPPDLHRRVLTLCSGRLPRRHERDRVVFDEVPKDIARRVLHSLLDADQQEVK